MQGGKQSLALRCRNIGLQLRLVRPDRATDLARHGVAGERHADFALRDAGIGFDEA